MEKIHWITTKSELAALFEDVTISKGPRGIHFVILNEAGLANNAFIEVASEQDYEAILAFNCRPKIISGNYQVGRFIKGSLYFIQAISRVSMFVYFDGEKYRFI